MPKQRTKEYKTYSFKCLVGRDDDLIRILEAARGDRSAQIRSKLRSGLRMPLPAEPEALTVDALRSILAELFESGVVVQSQRRLRTVDVNDNGSRIPKF